MLIRRFRLPKSTGCKDAIHEHEAGVESDRSRAASIVDIFRRKDLLVAFAGLLVFYSLTDLAANAKRQFGTYVNVVGLTVQHSSLISLLTRPVSIGLAVWFI